MASWLWRTGLAIAVAAGVACASAKLPSPPYTSHPTDALQPVPYPPPAPRVENVPARPTGSAAVVWIDGEWIWQTRRWTWRRGRWVRPVPGARYAPWTSVRDENGNLFVAAGTWRDARGTVVAEPGLPSLSDDAPTLAPLPGLDASLEAASPETDADAGD
jgi:hypothetical protein